MKRVILLVILLFSNSGLFSQEGSKLIITFHPVFGQSNLILPNAYFKINNNDSILFEKLQFYVSSVELLKEGIIAFQEENSFHLINAADSNSLNIAFTSPMNISFNQIKFNIGIDSITNVSGAMGGDLDPTRGMYWTWQNGYINFKLEGKSNLCKTRNNEFQFHLGGYQYPFNNLQKVVLNAGRKEKIDIVIDVKKFIDTIDLTNQNHVMSPGKEAVSLSEKLPEIFYIMGK